MKVKLPVMVCWFSILSLFIHIFIGHFIICYQLEDYTQGIRMRLLFVFWRESQCESGTNT